MSETDAGPALAKYRDAILELIRAGEPFGDVEDAMNAHAGLIALSGWAKTISSMTERQRIAVLRRQQARGRRRAARVDARAAVPTLA